MIFSSNHDHSLKNLLKGSSAPADLFGKEPFAEMLRQVDEAMDGYNHKLKKTDDEFEAPKFGEEDLAAFLPEGVESCPEEHEQAFASEVQEAADLVDRFVKFIPECGSKTELAQALEGTAVAKKQPEDTMALLILDTKTCGESSSQPHLRLPQFRAGVLKNAVQAFCTARGKDQFEENELCLVLDGGRQISSGIMSCFVRDDGIQFEQKTRSEFVVYFEEKALRARKLLNRGLIQVHEGMHVLSKGPLQLPVAKTGLYGGSNMSSSIGPVVLDPLDQLWLVTSEEKKKYEGGKAKVLAGGGLPDAPKKPEFKSGEPLTYHPMPLKFYKELLHSFCGGVAFFIADADGFGAMAAVLAKTPCVSLVYTADHAAALKARLTEWVFKEFQSQSSGIYRVSLILACNC